MKRNQTKIQKQESKIVIAGLILSFAFFTPNPAFAEDTGQERFQKFLENHPEFVEKADRNGDGEIDEVERRQARQILRKKWAKNQGQGQGNGQNQGQRPRFEEFLENHPEMIDKFDSNGDGVVDKTERKQARQNWHEKREDRWSENHPNAADRMDRNDDGDIDRREWKQGKKAKHEFREDKWSKKHPKAADRMDRNNDGDIDRREKKKARQVHDRRNDNNPPGPRGGQGTNWENRPGPQGGPGASPDVRKKK